MSETQPALIETNVEQVENIVENNIDNEENIETVQLENPVETAPAIVQQEELEQQEEQLQQKQQQQQEQQQQQHTQTEQVEESMQQQQTQQTQQTEKKDQLPQQAERRTSLTSSFSNAMANINPIASKVNQGIHQVIQFAGEKIGAVNKTELPVEYTLLEARIDKLKAVYENMIKLSALQIMPGSTLRFTLYDAVSQVSEKLGGDSERIVVDMNNVKVNQAFALQYAHAGKVVGEETPLGTALMKTAEVQDKIAKSRFQMYNEINEKMIKQMNHTLDTKFRHIYLLRRSVFNNRLRLDAIKSIARSAPPSKVEELGDDITKAQDEFQVCVIEAVKSMRDLLKSTDAISCLAAYHKILLNYFQSNAELLAEVSPEIDSIKVAYEASLQAEQSEQ